MNHGVRRICALSPLRVSQLSRDSNASDAPSDLDCDSGSEMSPVRKSPVQPLVLGKKRKSETDIGVQNDADVRGKFNDEYDILELLGTGSTAKVFKARLKSRHADGGSHVALKQGMSHSRDSFDTEKTCLQRLSESRHVVKMYCHFLDQERSVSYLVLEYMDHGSLQQLLKRCGTLPQPCVHALMVQLLRGLEQCKIAGLVHRDLKPHNILLNSMGEAKLADFGISKRLTAQSGRCSTFCGTTLYMSPERLQGRSYGAACDIWSVGVACFRCITGSYFGNVKGDDFWAVLEMALKAEKFVSELDSCTIDESLRSFLLRCLGPEENRCPTELLEHDYVLSMKAGDSFSAFQSFLRGLPLHSDSTKQARPCSPTNVSGCGQLKSRPCALKQPSKRFSNPCRLPYSTRQRHLQLAN